MNWSHLAVLLVAFYAGLIIASKSPGIANTATLGLLKTG